MTTDIVRLLPRMSGSQDKLSKSGGGETSSGMEGEDDEGVTYCHELYSVAYLTATCILA